MTGNTRVKHKYLTFITKRTKNHLNHFPNTFDDKKLFNTFEPLGYATGENFAAFSLQRTAKTFSESKTTFVSRSLHFYLFQTQYVNNTY